MRSITTDKAPAAIGPYSQAVEEGNLIFCSGQIGIDFVGQMKDGIEEQTKQIFANITSILKAAGSEPSQVVKTTVYLADMNDFPKINALYEEFFGVHKPARATVEVSRLPKDALVEIDAIAIKK